MNVFISAYAGKLFSQKKLASTIFFILNSIKNYILYKYLLLDLFLCFNFNLVINPAPAYYE